jgi:peptidoglycan/xylan/chitin deacetylase (PgdA/CDA1 family)
LAVRKLILTFDVEDFINPNEITALQIITEMLEKHDLRALFFITAHLAEKLKDFPNVLSLLQNHEIGFHSSGHSVHPTIPEYTDVEDYAHAYKISLERESSHINPLTGKIEGEGGINVLRNLFTHKEISAFRAPGMSWTPPNLEALVKLGIKFDFSSNLTNSKPIWYKGVTFFPYTYTQKWDDTLNDYKHLFASLLKRDLSVLDLHPSMLVNQREWDSIYYQGNPLALSNVQPKLSGETNRIFVHLTWFLNRISLLQKAHLIEVTPALRESTTNLRISKDQVERVYDWSMRWPRNRFHYYPKFVRKHFHRYFESAISNYKL